ncbi:hypothetical protein ES703_04117 [subsurface metagenome]
MTEEELRAVLERLNGTLAGFGARQDSTNLLLLRMVLAMGLEPPEAVKFLLELIPGAEQLPGIAVPLGIPYSDLNRESTEETTYIDILEWVIPAGHTGELFEISLATSDYAKTMFRLVIANVEQWMDQYLISSFTQKFKDNKLTENMKVLIQAKSSDGSGVTAYGAIAGKLIPPPYRKVGYGL